MRRPFSPLALALPFVLPLVLSLVLSVGLVGCSSPAVDPPGAPSSAPTSTSTPAPTASQSGNSAGPTGGSSSGSAQSSASASSSASSASVAELPRGGRTLFPHYRLVGYVGYPGSPALGRLGTGNLDERVDEIERRGRSYADGRQVLPVLELITVVVQASPGAGGKYRVRISDAVIERYLKAARRHKALLLLDIQPGRSDFLTEVKSLSRWLREPDVGLALDPEWAMGPGQVPGRVFGSTTGAELDSVGRYVSELVRQNNLPQKPIVYHQVASSVVRSESNLRNRSGVVWIKSVDGIGSRAMKTNTYRVVNRATPDFVHGGFKLFFDEDRQHGALMTPAQVLALRPKPEYVMYE